MSAEAAPAQGRGAHWLVGVFAGIGLLGVLAFIVLVALLSSDGGFERAKVADAQGETVFSVGDFQELEGTNLVSVTVAASEREGGYSSYSRDDRRNILLIDTATGTSRRILPDNERRISTIRYLSAKGDLLNSSSEGDLLAPTAPDGTAAATKEAAPSAYFVLSLFQQPSGPLEDVIVGTLAGGRQAVVMSGIDGIDTMWMHSPTQIGMLVREKLGLYHRIVDIGALKVVQSRRIDIG